MAGRRHARWPGLPGNRCGRAIDRAVLLARSRSAIGWMLPPQHAIASRELYIALCTTIR
jgi:hypothetical protein